MKVKSVQRYYESKECFKDTMKVKSVLLRYYESKECFYVQREIIRRVRRRNSSKRRRRLKGEIVY